MSDIIQLLPDSVANQIAAGEVIQRPASVVKELVENSVDAGAMEVTVVIKDAGRTLIQVIDDGMGMSDTDARLSFERHATSKIRVADDLFGIRTKGFRGEALASIAAIAQVILRTRKHDQEIGTEILIQGFTFDYQKQVSCPAGTNFQVKNLFYNIPARRKFLKSNATELKHIITEFQRIVLAHPGIAFNLIHNDEDIYRLPRTNLRQRIVNVFGKSINSNLNTLQTDTDLIKINGFIGKAEHSKKTSGEQYFFINDRYMRHPYFHRAVLKAYERILPPESVPSYFIYLEADPASIDVNIHPTKTEIKFEQEQFIFQILLASVREALGKSSALPSIDFETEGVVDIPVLRAHTEIRFPEIDINPAFNPFDENTVKNQPYSNPLHRKPTTGWESLYSDGSENNIIDGEPIQSRIFNDDETEVSPNNFQSEYLQVRTRYILTPVKSGLMVIDQKRAHERIIYEQIIRKLALNQHIAQRMLYPTKIDLDPIHYRLLKEIVNDLNLLGIEVNDLGSNTIVINSFPAGYDCSDPKSLIEEIIEEYKKTQEKAGKSLLMNIAVSLAGATSIGYGKVLQNIEMAQLVDELFACEQPNFSPTGKKIIAILPGHDLDKLLS